MPVTYVARDRFDHSSLPCLDVLGPVLRYIAPGDEAAYSLIEATLEPGVSVPLHSHADRETFFVLSGSLEAWTGSVWVMLRSGDVLDVPGHLSHALRNSSGQTETRLLLITTPSMARFFKEIALPISGGLAVAPTAERLQAFAESAARHGYWLASAEENRAIGLSLG